MAIYFIVNNFNDETIGTVPSGDLGVWSIVGDITVELWENKTFGDTWYFETKTLEFNTTTLLNARADYDFPFGGSTSGKIYSDLTVSCDIADGNGFNIVYGQKSPDLSIGALYIASDKTLTTKLSNGSIVPLYAKDDFSTLDQAKLDDPTTSRDYTNLSFTINMDDNIFQILSGGKRLGYDNNGVWDQYIPFHNDVVFCNTIYMDKLSGATQIGNLLSIGAYGGRNLIDPPDKFTLISPFQLDNATVTSSYYFLDYLAPGPIETTPDRKDVYSKGQNVLKDAASLKWESEHVYEGDHRLLFDFGAGNTSSLKYIGIFNHNFNEAPPPSPGPFTGGFIGKIQIVAGDVLEDLWTSPDLLIDVIDQILLDPISGFLPTHTARRYYGIRITISFGSLISIDNLSIGRVTGATSEQVWTASIDPSINYSWSDIDQSFNRSLRNNTLFSREKNNRRKFDFHWNFLQKSDQEELREIFLQAGIHSQYICMLDPDDRPETYTILSYINPQALTFNRICSEGAKLNLSFDEVVE